MIRSITPTGRYVQVTNNTSTPYFSPGTQGAGQVRYNTNTSNMEAWDGVVWKDINGGYTSIGLSSEAETLLDWARTRRDQDLRLEALMELHPGIRDLKEKLDIMVALAAKEQNGTR